MARLIDGGVTNALLIHFLSYIFLYRQGFFNTHHRIKLIIGGCLLAAAIASQIRFGYIILSQQLIRLFEMGFVVFVTAVFLRPQIRQIVDAEQILHLPLDLYGEEDAAILRKIIAGEKYETIARETGRSVSAVKNHIHGVFQRLQVTDRVSFLSHYATHRIVREEKNN
ncbi:hypothetical protein AGMMS50267_17730 [Spirochaetia bacterium]|nr:hypothetical protein AGMMS50267_17730 [Spirochaetia bacterium]